MYNREMGWRLGMEGTVLSEGGPSHAEDPCGDFGQGTRIPEGKTSSAG